MWRIKPEAPTHEKHEVHLTAGDIETAIAQYVQSEYSDAPRRAWLKMVWAKDFLKDPSVQVTWWEKIE